MPGINYTSSYIRIHNEEEQQGGLSDVVLIHIGTLQKDFNNIELLGFCHYAIIIQYRVKNIEFAEGSLFFKNLLPSPIGFLIFITNRCHYLVSIFA
jgi:hypothetical protein